MASSYYRSLPDYLSSLDKQGLLLTIDRPTNKDTELHPLMRLQFLGLPEEQRRAILFTNVVDGSGRRYEFPVVIGHVAGSAQIYAAALQGKIEAIRERLVAAQAKPLPPVIVAGPAPAQEVVLRGEALAAAGGLGILPIPISTPGYDNAPYTTAGHWLSKDPETGIRNVGNYRGQLKAPLRLGCFVAQTVAGLGQHWRKARAMGLPHLEVALLLGTTPNISHAAVSRIPHGLDELAMAGAIAGEPISLVPGITVGLEVPAASEIVVEGIIPTDCIEPEGPFGEFPGYMAQRELTLFCEVTAITYRRGAIYPSFVSQFPPSESSKLRQISKEQVATKLLRVDKGLRSVVGVTYPERGGSAWGLGVVQMKNPSQADVWTALESMAAQPAGQNVKVAIAVDDDIDPIDLFSVLWAISYRFFPADDVRIADTAYMNLDYSVDPEEARSDPRAKARQGKVLLLNATRKHDYPPVSLPAKEYMDNARAIWEGLGLPQLSLPTPWHGYELGRWTDQDREEAARAVTGRYYETGEEQAKARVSGNKAE